MGTIGVKRLYEMTYTNNNGDPCLVPTEPRNHIWHEVFSYTTRRLYGDGIKYCAFPYMVKIGSSYVGIFSEGDAHGDSDRQKMIRSDTGDFSDARTVTFFENSTSAYDFSLLDGSDEVYNTPLLANGESETWKVFTVTNTLGVFAAVVQSTVVNAGITYAKWSREIPGPSSKYYCTGYGANGSDLQTALLEKPTKGGTWVFNKLLFSGSGKLYSECDFVNTTGTTWLFLCREDSNVINNFNDVYIATSTNDMSTISSATLSTFEGRQPNIRRFADNRLMVALAKRTGSSGFDANGVSVSGGQSHTGIAIWCSTNAGSAWSFLRMISRTYSTDGGQPFVCEISGNTCIIMFYCRIEQALEPYIWSVKMNVANL